MSVASAVYDSTCVVCDYVNNVMRRVWLGMQRSRQLSANYKIYEEIIRFDKVFGNSDMDDLQDLKSRFPIFFPKQYHDSIWKIKMNDTLTRQLFAEVIKRVKKI